EVLERAPGRLSGLNPLGQWDVERDNETGGDDLQDHVLGEHLEAADLDNPYVHDVFDGVRRPLAMLGSQSLLIGQHEPSKDHSTDDSDPTSDFHHHSPLTSACFRLQDLLLFLLHDWTRN